MRIKAKISFAGNSFSAGVGEVIDVSDAIGKDLISAGYAIEEPEDTDAAAKATAAKTAAKAAARTTRKRTQKK